jgi:hypothetical protein
MPDRFVNCDDADVALFDDCDRDPFPGDDSYEGFLDARAKLERKVQRLYSSRKVPPPPATRKRPLRYGTRQSIRRLGQRMHHRAPRSARVARHASSGVGNEASDGDPEPPWRPWQRGGVFGHKKYKKHRTADYMSGYQEGGHHG